jgi:hypothetical protein
MIKNSYMCFFAGTLLVAGGLANTNVADANGLLSFTNLDA